MAALGLTFLLAWNLLSPQVASPAFHVEPTAVYRSYEELSVFVSDNPAVGLNVTFQVENPVGPYINLTKFAYLNVTVQLGPELTVGGNSRWQDRAVDNWNASLYMHPQVVPAIQNQLREHPDTPVFTTLNTTVIYTDSSGDSSTNRMIVRSVTFPLNYHSPSNALLLPAAVGLGLGGAGVIGIGVFVVRRARLDELFLMHDSGMLIRHWSRRPDPTHDSDILSGMFIVLQEFVRDTWKSYDDGDADLEELRFGAQRVVLARGTHSVLAAVIQGRYLNGLPKKLRKAVVDFERPYEGVLANWNGNLDLLPKADAVAEGLLKKPAQGA